MKLCSEFLGVSEEDDSVKVPHQEIAFIRDEGCPMCRVLKQFLKISEPMYRLANVSTEVTGLLFDLGLHRGPDNTFKKAP